MHTVSFRKTRKIISDPLSTRVSIYKNRPDPSIPSLLPHPSFTLFNPAFVATARHSQEARINEPWLQARLSLRFAVQTVTLLYREWLMRSARSDCGQAWKQFCRFHPAEKFHDIKSGNIWEPSYRKVVVIVPGSLPQPTNRPLISAQNVELWLSTR